MTRSLRRPVCGDPAALLGSPLFRGAEGKSIMRTGIAGLAAGLALVAGLAGTAAAQPTAKGYLLNDTMRQTLWCSAILYEESFWYEPDNPWSVYYDELSWALDETVYANLIKAGATDIQYDDLWTLFDGEAYMLSSDDEEGFLAEVIACEDEFGHLVPAPEE